MSDSNAMVTLTQDGNEGEVSLMDIAGMDMSGIQEFEGGFEPTPKGVYHFRCKDAELKAIEAKGIERAIIQFTMEIVNVLAFVEDGINPDEWIGKEHQEGVFITDVAKGVGQAKAIMSNAGFTGNGSLQELLDAFVGTEFDAPVSQRKDKNDPDRIYSNLKIGKIVPHAVEQAAAGGIAIGQ